MNFSKITNWTESGNFQNKSKIGYQLGAIGEIGITNRLSFQTELTFISNGTKLDDTSAANFDAKIKTKYIGIPLLARMSFNVLGLRKVYAMGGSYQNIRTGGSLVSNEYNEPLNSDGWRSIDWGLMLGAGAEYPLKEGNIGLDLRYEMGFLDAHISDAAKNRHRSFSFNLVYKFDIVDFLLKL
jgi:opacity protein-like surface antigen